MLALANPWAEKLYFILAVSFSLSGWQIYKIYENSASHLYFIST